MGEKHGMVSQANGKFKWQRGISLNEIIITAGIAGMLTCVFVPVYQKVISESNQTSLQQTARKIQYLLDQIYLMQNPVEYPTEEMVVTAVTLTPQVKSTQQSEPQSSVQISTDLTDLQAIVKRLQHGEYDVQSLVYERPSAAEYSLTITNKQGKTFVISPNGVQMIDDHSAVTGSFRRNNGDNDSDN